MPSLFELLLPKDAERQGFRQDVSSLQQFIQAQQQRQQAEQQLAFLQSLPLAQRQKFQGPVPNFPAFTPFPRAQSRPGAGLFGDFLLNQQQFAGRTARARAKPISLGRESRLVTPGGQTIIPAVPKTVKRTKATVLLKQIDKKIAAGRLKEGSAEHLRLLGASGDTIKTPEDKLRFWQTVLQKTKDAIGTTFEGQESTAELAASKIEGAKNEIRVNIKGAGTTPADPLGIR